MQKQLIEELNKQLANWNVLNTKLHNYHWNVTGSDFFTLHTKFEEFYNEAATTIDEIAERILTIGGKPVASLSEYLKGTTLSEATGTETAREMVAAIAKDFEQIVAESNELIEVAEKANDESTADMFIQVKTTLEQHIWMLKAFLG
ncbi:Dps family protein [Desertibacillus haloalkaliphilus]|uniref:Dps family protein n=1 Tax=Desertibacillus haloalkaliphilus TaxID=1328930 RepID=UPI001C278688|nr:Dps family protein [Desertibacillus haloalkaliphilus]MBU8907575.1 DNA starvation/stationary phase protection protein [Desertibacillus haloalkaliphilus]